MKNTIIGVLVLIAIAYIATLIADYNSPEEVAKRKAAEAANRQLCQTAQYAQTEYCINLASH